MKCFSVATWFLVLLSVTAAAEPPKEQADTLTIPLDQMWAFDMPGTEDIRELEPAILRKNLQKLPTAEQFKLLRKAIISKIAESLSTEAPSWPREGGKAEKGFAASGSSVEVVHRAFAALVDGDAPRATFSTDDRIHLFFFSHSFESYVYIRQVVQRGNAIEIRYSVVPHTERHVTPNFAIIPLGNLPAGKYDVTIIPLPLDQKYKQAGFKPMSEDWLRRMVCGSFSFDVERR